VFIKCSAVRGPRSAVRGPRSAVCGPPSVRLLSTPVGGPSFLRGTARGLIISKVFEREVFIVKSMNIKIKMLYCRNSNVDSDLNKERTLHFYRLYVRSVAKWHGKLKRELKVKPDVFLRAALQYCPTILPFW
jgi:hypothetical protein